MLKNKYLQKQSKKIRVKNFNKNYPIYNQKFSYLLPIKTIQKTNIFKFILYI